MSWLTETEDIPPGRYVLFGGWWGHYQHPDHDEWFCTDCGDYIDEDQYAWVLESDVDINLNEEPGDWLSFHTPTCAYRYLTREGALTLTLIREELL